MPSVLYLLFIIMSFHVSLDLNNPPTISPNEASLYVKENTANAEIIFQLKGSDFDNDQLTYHWRFQSESGSMYFSLSKCK